MFNLVFNMLTKGDIAPLNNAMLHSSFWAQGGAKLYTTNQQSRCWLNWLANAGMLNIDIIAQSQFANRTLVMANASLKKGQKNAENQASSGFLMGFDIEHNDTNIKSVTVNADPVQVAHALRQDMATLKAWWPTADPLELSDVDHQLHPNTLHASPSLLLASQTQVNDATIQCLDHWWRIHQQTLVGEIFDCYATNAVIVQSNAASEQSNSASEQSNAASAAGEQSNIRKTAKNETTEHLSVSGYFNHITQEAISLNHAYYQLIDLNVDGNTAFINWRIEADSPQGRIRQSLFSLIKISKDKITHQYTIKS